uniref:E3 ubiquitin/ISG15 ligase TRIM25-like n=1 Tax=Gadus morhua TaxID=8049 RepID=A0A8C5CBW4_GADMO
MKSDCSTDLPLEVNDGNQSTENRIVQQERADCPGPSCVSMETDLSMAQHPESKDGNPQPSKKRPLQERSKDTSAQSAEQHQADRIKRAEEHTHAFLDKELKKLSKDLFLHYPQCSESEREEEEVDGKMEEQKRRAIEGVVDITKLCLMEMNQQELADTLRGGMVSATTSGSEENFSCPICLDVFNSPVSTPCGHNFCRTCITKFWDDKDQYKCPVCNELFHTRPDIQDNTLLSEMVDQFRRSVRVKEQPCVEPEVPCDICTGTQLKAVKSCLVCFISYCQTHLEPHQRVTVLKRHELVEPMDRLEEKMCKKHNQPLELFCQTEQVCVCQLCTVTDHKSHPVVPLKEEYEVKMAQLGEIESEVQQTIQERQRKIEEIKDREERCKADAASEIAPGVQALNALKDCIVDGLENLDQMVKEKLKSTEEQVSGLVKELEQEIEDIRSEVKQLSHIEDPLHFLQTLRSLNNPPDTRDWTTVEIHCPSMITSYIDNLDRLIHTLNRSMDRVPDLESALKRYGRRLTLDGYTAHKELSLSQYNRTVTMDKRNRSYFDHPKKFDSLHQVLCREGLTGRCYWEVEWERSVEIGVTYRGIPRKGNEGGLARHNQAWCLYCRRDRYTACHNNKTRTYIRPDGSTRVGVYLDRPAGTLSFYRVSPDGEDSSDTLKHIHTFQSTFTEELYPAFGMCGYDSSVKLC